MLLYDTRYRSATIQVIAMFGFMLLAAWLINNTIINLNTLGKPVSFGFLGETAGYDINQRLLDYDNQDTHLRAAFLGLLNTLVIAFMAVSPRPSSGCWSACCGCRRTGWWRGS